MRITSCILALALLLAGCSAGDPPAPTPLPAAGDDWLAYEIAGGAARWRYPPGWSETAPGVLEGADGFARAELRSSGGAGPGAVCQGEANREKPERYGALPEIRDLEIAGRPACLILPAADQPAARAGESALFAWLPAPTPGGEDLLSLRASRDHILAIAESLELPGPAPEESACDFTPAAGPVEVVSENGLRVDHIPLAAAEGCDPTAQPGDFYRFINTGEPASRLEQLRLRQSNGERLARLNARLSPFGLNAQTYGEGLFRLRRGGETLRENISWVGPLTAGHDNSDFLLPVVDGYNAVAYLADPSGVQALDDPDLLVYDNVFPVIAGDARIRLAYDYEAIPRPPGDPALLRVFQDDQEIQVLSVGGATPAAGPARGLWSHAGSWFLELPGLVIQDGAILNDSLGCAEMFGWRLLKDQPFVFCRQQGALGAYFNGQPITQTWDAIIHEPQTGAAQVVQMRAYESGLAFLARRSGIWYFVVIEAQ